MDTGFELRRITPWVRLISQPMGVTHVHGSSLTSANKFLSDPYTVQMALDSELASALHSDPVFLHPQAPPEGVPLPDYAREQAKIVIAPFSKFYGNRPPSGMCIIVS